MLKRLFAIAAMNSSGDMKRFCMIDRMSSPVFMTLWPPACEWRDPRRNKQVRAAFPQSKTVLQMRGWLAGEQIPLRHRYFPLTFDPI
jgi:hypothetical protein